MIIYKIQENGRATDFNNSRKCPAGWKSIPGDRIPEDITPYHEQRYIDENALKDQESELLRLISDNEYHLYNDEYLKDRPAWVEVIAKWHAQRKEVKSGKLVEIAEKPF